MKPYSRKSLLFLLIIFVVTALPGSAQDDTTSENFAKDSLDMLRIFEKELAESKYNEGVKSIKIGDYNRAVSCFDEALALLPEFDDAFFNRALAKMELGTTDAAIDDFTKAIDLKPEAIRYYSRGLLYYNSGDSANARLDFIEAVNRDRFNSQAAFYLGMIRFKQKSYKLALDAYNLAIKADPGYAMAYHDCASIYRLTGDTSKSIAGYRKAIEIDPKMFIAWKNLGGLQRAKNQQKEAIFSFRKALDLRPSDPGTLHAMALIHFDNLAIDSCIYYCNLLIKTDSEYAYGYNTRGNALYKKEEYEMALKDYDKAINLEPDYGFAYLNRGIVKELLRDDKGACSDWKRAFELGVKSAKAYIDYVCNN